MYSINHIFLDIFLGISKYGINPQHHIIAANEGNCTALTARYHLSTGKIPVVYMQNNSEGKIINPVASRLNISTPKIGCVRLSV